MQWWFYIACTSKHKDSIENSFIENRNEIWRKTRATHQSLKTNLTGKYVGADLLNKIKTHAKSNSLPKKTGRYARDLEIHHMTPLSSAVKQSVGGIFENQITLYSMHITVFTPICLSDFLRCPWSRNANEQLPIDDAWSFSDREKFTACQ